MPSESNKDENALAKRAPANHLGAPAVFLANREDLQHAIFSVVNSVGKESTFTREKFYRFVFILDEDRLKLLCDRSFECIGELAPMPESTTIFSAETVGRDGSKRIFSDLNFLLSRSAEKDDLLSVTLRWGRRLSEPLGSKAEIVLAFQVEGKVKLENGFTFENDNPLVRLQISGESDGWVEATFERIEPYIKETRVERLYSYLEFLKKQGWNFVLSFAASCVAGWYIWILIGKHFADERELFIESSRKTLYDLFKSMPTIEEKMDIIARNVIWPPDYINREPSISIFIFMIIFMLIISVSVASTNVRPFSYLAPRSFIAIGLAKFRYQRDINLYKFVVFTIIIGGTLSAVFYPLVGKLLFGQ